MPLSRTSIQITVNQTGSYVTNGNTTFTFHGATREAGVGGQDYKEFILSIHTAYARGRRDLAELSLVKNGDLVAFEVEGILHEDGFIEVDRLHSVKNITNCM